MLDVWLLCYADGKYIDTIDAKAPESELVRLMVGRSIENQYPRVAQQPGKTLLEVKDLTRAGAIDHVSFDVHAGEVVGLAGLVGAGRTEVLRAILVPIHTIRVPWSWMAFNCQSLPLTRLLPLEWDWCRKTAARKV